jgi:ribosome-associated protein
MPQPPTQDPRPRPPALSTADAPLTPSTSQRKRDAHALQAIGVQLVALSAAQLARLDLPEALHEAVVAAQRMRSHGARTRQTQSIGKVMRQLEPTALRRVRAALTPGRAVTPRPQPSIRQAQGRQAGGIASAIPRAAGRWTVAGVRQRRGLRHLVLAPAQPIALARADTCWRG